MDLMSQRRILLANDRLLLPPNYKKADYIQRDTYSSRIDTGINGNDNALIFDAVFIVLQRASYNAIFGNYLDENTRCWRILQPSGTGDTRQLYFSALNRKAGSSAAINVVGEGQVVTNNKVHLRVSYGSVTATSGGHTSTVSPADQAIEEVSNRNVCIGAHNPNATNGATAPIKFYLFRIHRGQTLIRNYVPCYRISDSKAGFYDTVNHTFNPSIGTADFVAGYDS